MRVPIDRRAAFGGMVGATLGYGVSTAAQDTLPEVERQPSGPITATALRTKLAERPSITDKGARGDGIASDAAAIQDALRSFDTIWVPRGVYLIDEPLTLPSYCVVEFAADAIFIPARDGMTIFRTGEVSYASRVIAPRVHARGKRGVTAFDLQGFRHRAEIAHADILGCERGIVLRELCWDTLIHMPWIRDTAHPIVIANGSNAVDVVHPGIDGCETGIEIATGPRHTTTSVRVWGGYVQNGRQGIVDRGCFGTVVDGTYFEGLSEADIILSGSIRSNLSRTQHYGDKGQAAMRMVRADGATVLDPTMTSGSRAVGLYDIDDLSRHVTRFDVATDAGLNSPPGRLGSAATLVREEGGSFAPALAQPGSGVGYGRREGRWRRAGRQLTVSIDLAWRGAAAGRPLLVSGMPVLPAAMAPVAAVATAVVTGSGGGGTYARLEPTGLVRFLTIEDGQEKPLVTGASGSVSVTIACLA